VSYWTRIPAHFPFSVQENPADKRTLRVLEREAATSGGPSTQRKKIERVPNFVKENLDKAHAILARLRTGPKPKIEYITNIFSEVQRSSGRAHVVGQILIEDEVPGQRYDIGQFAAEAQASRHANCDRASALAAREAQQAAYGIKDPVVLYWTDGQDHNTVFIGDPRMRKYGEANTVVLDAHPVFPMAHTKKFARYEATIPREGEEGSDEVEIWNVKKSSAGIRHPDSTVPPVSSAQITEWLRQVGWPSRPGQSVVRHWYDNEILETGHPPRRWEHLFSSREPSMRYDGGNDTPSAYNAFPAAFVEQRVKAFLEIEETFPEPNERKRKTATGSGLSLRMRDKLPRTDDRTVAKQEQDSAGNLIEEAPVVGEFLYPVSTLHSRIVPVRGVPLVDIMGDQAVESIKRIPDFRPGRALMEIKGRQAPHPTIDDAFPIRAATHPAALPEELRMPGAGNELRCHPDVGKTVGVELPDETRELLLESYPPGRDDPEAFFQKCLADIRGDYEAARMGAPLPQASRWKSVVLARSQCYTEAQVQALVATQQRGVIPARHAAQNVGGMAMPFAGSHQKSRTQIRAYTLRFGTSAFEDFALQVRNPDRKDEHIYIAPYGGGNTAQYFNGRTPDFPESHFITLPVWISIQNKYGGTSRYLTAHVFQHTEVPEGKQGLLDYGPEYWPGRDRRDAMGGPTASGPGIGIKEEAQDTCMSDLPDAPAVPAHPGRRTRSSRGASSAERVLGLQLRQMAAPRHAVPDGEDDQSDSALSSVSSGFEGMDARQQPEPGYNKKSNEAIISGFPVEIWEEAKGSAREPGLPTGVAYHRATSQANPRYVAGRKIENKTVALGSFSVTGGRDDETAKAMAIATIMLVERKHGALRKKIDDDQIVSAFPPPVWEKAQARAKQVGLPVGVSFLNATRSYTAYINIDKTQRLLASFSATKDRSDAKARAMAIATRTVAEMEHGIRNTDEKTMAGLPDGVWEAAWTRAGQPGLPTGVSFHPSTATKPSPQYQVRLGSKSHGTFSVVEGRDDHTARALAIAFRMVAEQEHGGMKSDAQLIARFPDGVWEWAREQAKKPSLPPGVSLVEATGQARRRYTAYMKTDGKTKALGSFSVKDDRDDETARALAIAARRAAELQRQAARATP